MTSRTTFRWGKAAFAGAVGVTLAVLSGAHAFSSASLKRAPDLALSVWPANGLAAERIAFNSFVADVRQAAAGPGAPKRGTASKGSDSRDAINLANVDLQRIASAQSGLAIEALRHEPLASRAHVLLALSEKDASRRRQIVELASRLNRRELSLQSLVLQMKADAGDYPGTIATLDQILRVNPERQAEFFPALTTALRQSVTLPEFRSLLAEPIPWRDAFILSAVNDPAAARNLATIRLSVDFDNSEFDKLLIASLARAGDFQTAAALYRKFRGRSGAQAVLDWSSDYPPFDWSLTNERGLQAQQGRDGRELEIAIDPGNGGVLASRLVELPDGPFTITVRHLLSSPALAKDLKMSLSCFGEAQPFFEGTFADRKGRFDIIDTPACDYVLLSLSGRSWTGAEPLNGSITDVLIATR